jgi:hypothetical protein
MNRAEEAVGTLQFLLIQSQIRKRNKPKSAEFHLMNT